MSVASRSQKAMTCPLRGEVMPYLHDHISHRPGAYPAHLFQEILFLGATLPVESYTNSITICYIAQRGWGGNDKSVYQVKESRPIIASRWALHNLVQLNCLLLSACFPYTAFSKLQPQPFNPHLTLPTGPRDDLPLGLAKPGCILSGLHPSARHSASQPARFIHPDG